MNYSGLVTKLKLEYAPLSNHDFTVVKTEQIIQRILDGSIFSSVSINWWKLFLQSHTYFFNFLPNILFVILVKKIISKYF